MFNMIHTMPIEIEDIIYQFDGRYRRQYDVCIKEIKRIYENRLLNLSLLRNNYQNTVQEWINTPIHKHILWKCKTSKTFVSSN
jgi:hypothetical protein